MFARDTTIGENTTELLLYLRLKHIVYYYCPCCGIASRTSPINKRDKESLRQLKLREEEQNRRVTISFCHMFCDGKYHDLCPPHAEEHQIMGVDAVIVAHG
jgi:hypothetical protein